MKFLKQYFKAFNKEAAKQTKGLKKAMLEHPVPAACVLFEVVVLIALVIHTQAIYSPPTPQPTMTVIKFWDALFTVQLPWIIWVIAFVFLWLTKW